MKRDYKKQAERRNFFGMLVGSLFLKKRSEATNLNVRKPKEIVARAKNQSGKLDA